MLILTIVFGKLGRMPSAGIPYPLLVFCGMLPWQFFSTALSESGNSLVNNSNLISKIYFPRVIVPSSSVISSFVDFLISAGLLGLLMIYYHYLPSGKIVFLPIFVALALAASLGVGLWVGALMVKYRDFRFIVPFIVQFGLYISPVGFLSDVISEHFSDRVRLLYSLNPVVGVIGGFRWSLLTGQAMYWPGFVASLAASIILVLTGIWYFRKTERTFADII